MEYGHLKVSPNNLGSLLVLGGIEIANWQFQLCEIIFCPS